MPPSFAARTLNSAHSVPGGLPPPLGVVGGGGGPPLLAQHSQTSAFKYLSDSVQHSNTTRMDNDFPSLAAVNSGRGRMGDSQLRGYAGQFSKPPDQQSEFIITKDDFPALGKSNTSLSANPSAKTAVSEFHEQQAHVQAQSQLQAIDLSRSLRKEPTPIQTAQQPHTLPSKPSSIGTGPQVAPQKISQQPPNLSGLQPSAQTAPGSQYIPPSVTSSQLQTSSNPPGLQQNHGGQDPQAAAAMAAGKLYYDDVNNCFRNVSSGMIKNQFGLLALLYRTRLPSKKQFLTKGIDLTKLGIPLQRRLEPGEYLTDIFGGPFSDTPCRPQDIDIIVPKEYMTNEKIIEKLQKLDLDLYHEDTIFMLYYTHTKDVMSMYCAKSLYSKGWRYHKVHQRWLKRHDDKSEPIVDAMGQNIGENALFKIYDPVAWAKQVVSMELRYNDLEGDQDERDPSVLQHHPPSGLHPQSQQPPSQQAPPQHPQQSAYGQAPQYMYNNGPSRMHPQQQGMPPQQPGGPQGHHQQPGMHVYQQNQTYMKAHM